MIQKLQHRFILITMASVLFIFALVLVVLNISVNYSAMHQGFDTLYEYNMRQNLMESMTDGSDSENRVENDTSLYGDSAFDTPASETADSSDLSDYADLSEEANFPGVPAVFPGNEEESAEVEMIPAFNWFDDMRIMYVIYNSDETVTDAFVGSNPDMTEDTLLSMANKVLHTDKENGRDGSYLYIRQNDNNLTKIYFLDYGIEKSMSRQLLRTCLFVGIPGTLLIFVLVYFLSRWTTKPVQLAFDKQKQFIADASHELKTPLTIITTNAEVLNGSLPDNKWLTHILDQSARMKQLINDLLSLARLDAYSNQQEYIPMDFSRCVQNTALSFESLAFEYHKEFTMDVEEGLMLSGNEEQIRQLVTILLDNAFKYSDEHGKIHIRLHAHGDRKTLLIRNTGNGIPEKDQEHIFERFYRSESSRNRLYGGYGLGLAIAKAIVDAHHGQLQVKSDGASYTSLIATFS